MTKRYKAFISYSQLDKKWAKKLQRSLENYRIPTAVLADINATSDKFGKVFRDDDDISASESLGAALEGALDDSETLVAICSPNSAQSKWVDMEVRRFKRASDARYFAVIVDGKPNADDPADECFVPALRYRVDEDGELTSEPDEPLAPDWRKDGTRKLTARLVAGILGLSFDDLWNRDRRRTFKIRAVVSTTALLTAALVTGLVVNTYRDQNDERAAQLIELSKVALGDALSDDLEEDRGSNYERAMRFAALASQTSVVHRKQPVAENLLSFAAQRAPIANVFPGHRGGEVKASFIRNENTLVSTGADRRIRRWNNVDGSLTSETPYRGSALAISPSGQLVAIQSDDSFYLQGPQQKTELVVPTDNAQLFKFAAFSADESRIIATSPDNSAAMVFAADTGALIAILETAETKPIVAALNKDGTIAAIAGTEDRLVIWNVSEQAAIKEISQRVGSDFSVTFTPVDDHILAGRGEDFYLYSIKDEKPLGLMPKTVFAPDAKSFASVVDDFEIELRSMPNAELNRSLRGHSKAINTINWNRTATKVLTASDDGTARLWDATSGREIMRFEGHQSSVMNAKFDSTEEHILTVGRDGTIRTHTIPAISKPTLKARLKGHQGRVNKLFFDESGKQLITVGEDKKLGVWDPQSATQLTTVDGHPVFGIDTVTLSSTEDRMLLAAVDGSVSVRKRSTGEETKAFPSDQSAIDQRTLFLTEFDANATLAITPRGRSAVIWDAVSGQEVSTLHPDSEQFYYVKLSPDGSKVISLSWEGVTRIWDSRTGTETSRLEGHSGVIQSADFSPDGKWVITAGQDSTAAIWDTESGAEIYTLKGFQESSLMTEFSPDGRYFIVSNSDGSARIFDTKDWQETQVLKGHSDGINIVGFDHTATKVITAGWDETVRVWDVASGLELFKMEFDDSIYSAAISPDGNFVAVSAGENGFTLWSLGDSQANTTILSPGELCDPVAGRFGGIMNLITREDIEVAPILAGREGENVCGWYHE